MNNPSYWLQGVHHLMANDERLALLINAHPDCVLKSRGDPFHTLMRSIAGQQISVQAADSIWRKMEAVAGDVAPHTCAAITREQWRECGFSRQKISYIENLIAFANSGQLDMADLHAMSDAALMAHITSVKGIGTWSAEMFAMFCLMRPNILPLADIGLQRAMAQQYGVRAKPFDAAAAVEIAQKWQPYCTIATWFLWRSIDPNEVNY